MTPLLSGPYFSLAEPNFRQRDGPVLAGEKSAAAGSRADSRQIRALAADCALSRRARVLWEGSRHSPVINPATQRNLRATVWPSSRSLAQYTSPMPPRPKQTNDPVALRQQGSRWEAAQRGPGCQ